MSGAYRWAYLGCAVVLIAMLHVAQGGCAGDGNNNTSTCSPATCPSGCCTQGQCVLGNTQAACGKGGAQCQVCPSGATCTSGACTPTTQQCGPTTCPQGCCSGNVCLPIGAQQNGAQCGTGGQACQSCGTAMCMSGVCQGAGTCDKNTCADGCCTAQGQCLQHAYQTPAQCGTLGNPCGSCGAGQCQSGQCTGSACNATNCTGCCTAQGQCLLPASQNSAACGTGGQACQSCGTSACTNGVCQGSCANCQQGCCSGTQCLLYAQQGPAACGSAGAPCMPCGAPGLCTNGICSGGGTCSPATCAAGCCSGNTCLLPDQQTPQACGLSGAACERCPTQAPSCNAGVCQACGPTSCPNGCCSGQQCILYVQQSKAACGKGGAVCAQCVSGQTCYDNTCMVAWKVSAISAVVTEKSPTDPWDPSGSLTGPLPDPQLRCRANSTGKSGTSNYIDDTLTPAWGRQELFVESEPNLANGITCTVQDDDGLFDADMGDCNFPTLSPTQLAGGQLSSGTGACSKNVTSVTIGFDKIP